MVYQVVRLLGRQEDREMGLIGPFEDYASAAHMKQYAESVDKPHKYMVRILAGTPKCACSKDATHRLRYLSGGRKVEVDVCQDDLLDKALYGYLATSKVTYEVEVL